MKRPLQTREIGGVLVITLDEPASVNEGQTDVFRQEVYAAIEDRPRPRVVVDLTPIDFLSSSGVALLIGLRRRVIAAGGALVLYRVHPYVNDLLEMMKVKPLFQIAADQDAALALLGTEPAV